MTNKLRYIGLDVHKDTIVIAVAEQGTASAKFFKTIPYDLARLVKEIRRLAGAGYVVVCYEAGPTGFGVQRALEKAGFDCRVVAPSLIPVQSGNRVKTDRRDASQLGQVLWINRQRLLEGKAVHGLRRVVPSTPEQEENRQLTALRQRIGQLRTRTLNKIQHVLLKHNLQQDCPTKGLQTQTARRWLAKLPLAEIDRLEMDLLLKQWELWESQLKDLEEKIESRQRLDETAAIVASMPGAGAYCSLALSSRIGSIERFPRPGSLANYWGITPGCRNSGDAKERLGSITKQGSVMARFILGQMVLHVLRKDSHMKSWYQRIKKRRGAKIARVAVMRRLACILWHMVKYKQPYVLGGSVHVKKVKETREAIA